MIGSVSRSTRPNQWPGRRREWRYPLDSHHERKDGSIDVLRIKFYSSVRRRLHTTREVFSAGLARLCPCLSLLMPPLALCTSRARRNRRWWPVDGVLPSSTDPTQKTRHFMPPSEKTSKKARALGERTPAPPINRLRRNSKHTDNTTSCTAQQYYVTQLYLSSIAPVLLLLVGWHLAGSQTTRHSIRIASSGLREQEYIIKSKKGGSVLVCDSTCARQPRVLRENATRGEMG